MDFVEKRGAVTAREVADAFGLSWGGAWSLLDRMRRRGLLGKTRLLWISPLHRVSLYLGELTGKVVFYASEEGLAKRIVEQMRRRWRALALGQRRTLKYHFLYDFGLKRETADRILAEFPCCRPNGFDPELDDDSLLVLMKRQVRNCGRFQRRIIRCLWRGTYTLHQLVERLNRPKHAVRSAVERLIRRNIVGVVNL